MEPPLFVTEPGTPFNRLSILPDGFAEPWVFSEADLMTPGHLCWAKRNLGASPRLSGPAVPPPARFGWCAELYAGLIRLVLSGVGREVPDALPDLPKWRRGPAGPFGQPACAVRLGDSERWIRCELGMFVRREVAGRRLLKICVEVLV